MRLPFKVSLIALIVSLLLQGGACGDYTKELPGGYLLVSEGPQIQEIMRARGQRDDQPYVPCNVVAYDYDDNFIIAKQHARFECFHVAVPGDARGPRQNPFNQRDGETYYWIIEAKKQVIHGPMAMEKFHSKRTELGVSEKLNV